MCWLPTKGRGCSSLLPIKRWADHIVGASLTTTQIFKINHQPEHPGRLRRNACASSRFLALKTSVLMNISKDFFFSRATIQDKQYLTMLQVPPKCRSVFPLMLIACRCFEHSVEWCELLTSSSLLSFCFLFSKEKDQNWDSGRDYSHSRGHGITDIILAALIDVSKQYQS